MPAAHFAISNRPGLIANMWRNGGRGIPGVIQFLRMVKVLLVYEDFNLLTLTESFLKKVGFDVQGVSNEVLIQDQILSFNPHIIVACGQHQRVSIVSVGRKLKNDKHFRGKLILLAPEGFRPLPQDLMHMKFDAILEQPLTPEKLITSLCRQGQLAPGPLLDKFAKARMSDPDFEQKMMHLMGGAASLHVNNFSDPARAQKYAKISKEHPISLTATTHQRGDIAEAQKQLKKDWDFDQLEKQDELKREFAKALFKKK